MNTVIRIASDAQRATAIEKQFTLTVERTFLRAPHSIGQRIGSAIGQDNKRAFIAQQVQKMIII